MLVCKQFKIDFAHRLAHHQGKCSNLHGHTAKIVIEIEGTVFDETGMVMDFGQIKESLKELIDLLDHNTILNSEEDEKLISCLINNGFRCFTLACEPTAENLAAFIFTSLNKKFEETNPEICLARVSFYETEDNWATYCHKDEIE